MGRASGAVGVEQAEALERVGNPVRQNVGGDYRTYVVYHVPNPRGGRGTTIREATYNRPEDPFNRAESVRQIPPTDPDYQRLIGRRRDAEAANRVIDDHLYLRRAISLGAQGQLSISSATRSRKTRLPATAMAAETAARSRGVSNAYRRARPRPRRGRSHPGLPISPPTTEDPALGDYVDSRMRSVAEVCHRVRHRVRHIAPPS
jgi:hypothetical protein